MFGDVGPDPVHRFQLTILQRATELILETALCQSYVGAPQRAELGAKRLVLQRLGPRRLEVVPQRFEQLADGLRSMGDLRIDRPALWVVVEDADAQPTRVRTELFDVRTCGRRAITVSPMPGPRVASSNAAVSRTVRLTQCSTDSSLSSRTGPSVMRPWLGLSPTRPQQDAGMRIDPPSLAWANGTIPDATAAAAPPLDPPGVRVVSHGLWVAPDATGSVIGTLPSSGLLVRPAGEGLVRCR